MTGEDIKIKIISIILKFHEITGDDELSINRSEFSDLSDAEINTTILTLQKNKLIEIIDNRAVKNDMNSVIHKASNPFGLQLGIKILDGFKKYTESPDFKNLLKDNRDSVILELSYSRRKLKVNKITIANPDFDRENDHFATLIMDRPNSKITINSFEKYKGSKSKKKFEQIVTDLGFKGNIKKLFFPNISKSIEFRNPITMDAIKKAGLNDIKLSDFTNKH